MQAVAVTAQGGPEVLQLIEQPDPVPGPGQVLVRVLAAVVHPADVAARLGLIPGGPVEPPFLPGWDFAGEVVQVGDDEAEYRPGDRVVGMVPWYRTRGAVGAYAELIAADTGWVVPLPDGLSPSAAATVPLNALTARQALRMMALPPASTVLVTGASGGVGGFAAQLAVRAGHRVLAVAGRDDEDWVRDLGVARVVPKDLDLAGIGPVPAVLDAVPLAEPAAAVVADGGVLLTTRPTPPVDPARGVRQQVVLIEFDQEALRELIVDVAGGRLRTRVAATLPLARAAEAHRMVEAGGVRGKVVLTP
ncbi:NADPH:quinone reductase-like Zn-dependent oxidoreductase [Micromonospora pisi]|uniref:NADPH:quinone reductase-like Zn-dependent oxidoreductase n=1 Tax=Micromonospora pisi TaxID=589240 RepID=A0A495JL99_9ACTN|nr:NADP-dependent oxidoreductase [Micromonospora pisi]RKR89830.1 NADPH:quinone reductase-like Zn-dependent oxidoreductase [Micromonospora pisi]